jgi:uracil-DNA glycosylase
MSIELNILPTVDKTWTIEQLSQECVPISWKPVFDVAQPELKHISKKLDKDKCYGDYLPRKEHIFNAFFHCPMDTVKVIILNREPYNTLINQYGCTVPKDIGLAYSIRKTDVLTKVLVNIYKELKNEYHDFITPKHGDLTRWCQQGVMLLNVSLTTSTHQSHTYSEMWHGFLTKMFDQLVKVNPNTIVVMWGKSQCLANMLPNSFIQLTAGDPMNVRESPGSFIGCNHFKLINEQLIKLGKTPIDWQI